MVFRQLRIAFKTVALQRTGHPSSNSARVHPLRVRTIASTPHQEAAETPNLKQTPLFQQLSANPEALLVLKQFGQLMKEQGIDFSLDRPPSTLQIIKLFSNSEFRKNVQKLRDDLAKAGVNVDPENAMEMLEAFKGHDKSK